MNAAVVLSKVKNKLVKFQLIKKTWNLIFYSSI